jgi:geranylgeranyl pyrophosphate synthase
MLTLATHRVLGGSHPRSVLDAAAAVEFYMSAAYLFDEVADREWTPERARSRSETLALGILLLTYGAATVTSACVALRARPSRIATLASFHHTCAQAAAGQFLDAHLQHRAATTPRQALVMTCLKAGSFGRLATTLGATFATEDLRITRSLARFGFSLFTYAQLLDDLRDGVPSSGAPGDLVEGKSTLPVVYFRRTQAASCSGFDHGTMDGRARDRFERSGAVLYGQLVAAVFRHRTQEALRDLARRGVPTQPLEGMLEQLTRGREAA